MWIRVFVFVSLLISMGMSYPIRCIEIGDSTLGTVADCDVLTDPFPFHYTATVRLKKNVKWAGKDDIGIMFSNPDDAVEGNCTTSIPIPTNYSKNNNVTIEQNCSSFNPPLVKGASLLIVYFLTHHDSFDDVLMFNYPIPGYVIGPEQPREILGEEKLRILKRIRGKLVKHIKIEGQ